MNSQEEGKEVLQLHRIVETQEVSSSNHPQNGSRAVAGMREARAGGVSGFRVVYLRNSEHELGFGFAARGWAARFTFMNNGAKGKEAVHATTA